MKGPIDWNGKRVLRWIGVGMVGLALITWVIVFRPSPALVPMVRTPAPAPPASAPGSDLTASMSAFAISAAPTPMPEIFPSATSEELTKSTLACFQGCWGLETEDLSLEIHLEPDGSGVQGTFLLVGLCTVAGQLSACRIREGILEGDQVTMDMLEIQLSIPEYDDEGAVRLTLGPSGATLRWEELRYPAVGLADGAARYLPPSLTLVPCGSLYLGVDPAPGSEICPPLIPGD